MFQSWITNPLQNHLINVVFQVGDLITTNLKAACIKYNIYAIFMFLMDEVVKTPSPSKINESYNLDETVMI